MSQTTNKPKSRLKVIWRACLTFWHRLTPWFKIPVYFLLIVAILASAMFGLGEWYIQKHKDEPLQLGTTFIADYAEYYGLDPQTTLQAILSDLQIKHIRFVSYWEDIEKSPGVYDYSQLDAEFALANQYGAKVSLAIGLRQPRWPECHAPDWVKNQPKTVWYPALQDYLKTTIARYQGNPALDTYQLENEFFLNNFGECRYYSFDRSRLEEEYSLVKSLDSTHKVILSQASNFFGLPLGNPVPDIYGVSVYKFLYDEQITHRYLAYPLPPWYFTARSALIELIHGKPSMLHELQGEPWGPTDIKNMSDAEQLTTMNADILDQRIHYGIDTGFRTVDIWGAEWWYWRKEVKNDPSMWNTVKMEVAKANAGDY